MNIKVSDHYKVTSDSHNHILLRKRLSNPYHHFSGGNAKESWDITGYYGNIQYLLDNLIQRGIEEAKSSTFDEMVKAVKSLKQYLVLEIEQYNSKPTFMKIKVGDHYRITSDSQNHTLSRKRLSNPNHHFSRGKTKESWDVFGYYSNIQHLVDRLVEKEIKEAKSSTFDELIKEVESLKHHLIVEIDQDNSSPTIKEPNDENE